MGRSRLLRWLGTADGRAVLVLLAFPLVVFVVPALFGHPAIGGDNAIQNFPLRVLSGRLIRQGHLPLWNQYIWSGSPLLGGLNAGSAYPLTLLFAVLPPVGAWVGNLLGVYWAAGLGVYVLLRQFGVRPLAGALAGLTYAFAGTMSGQIVHLGVVQGMGLVPWMVLAQLRLSWAVLGTGPRLAPAGPAPAGPAPAGPSPAGLAPAGPALSARRALFETRDGRSPWPWACLLAATLGLIVLTGEPRSMAEAEVVAGAVTIWLVAHPYGGADVHWRRRVVLAGMSALAAAWGVAIAALQIVPGWAFINASQRSSETYSYFGAGSLRPSWTALLLVPDLFGGDGILHQPTYFNSYSLPEVTGYVGLLPLVAAVALGARCLGRRRDPRAADWALWLTLGVLGLLLSWGSYTPLGHLWVHIPLFGKTRLQSRNLGIVDLALAVLLGFWADRALGRRPEEAGLGSRLRWLAVAPVVAAALLCVAAIAVPGPLEEAFGTTAANAFLARSLTPWFIAQLVVVVVAGGIVLGWRRVSPKWRRMLLTTVVALDVGLFMASSSAGLTDGRAQIEPTPAAATAVLGAAGGGRFAIYNTGGSTETLDSVGQPDLNAFTRLPSVQGYGSILFSSYGAATGTHSLDTLDICALAEGTFAPLRLATVLTPSRFLAPSLGADGQAPPLPPACAGAPAPARSDRRTFYLGQLVGVTSAVLVANPGTGPSGPRLRLGLLQPSGRTVWPAERVERGASGWTVELDAPGTAVGVVVAGPASAVSGTSVVSASDGRRLALDGVLQDEVSGSAWRYGGMWKQFTAFRATRVQPPVWLAQPARGAAVRQVSSTDDGTVVERVNATRPVTVVRSEAYGAGWHVQAAPAGGGPSKVLPVEAVGLVQGVKVPAGTWTLTFLYRPKGLDFGIAGTAVGLAALGAMGVWGLVRRSRGRGRGRGRGGVPDRRVPG